MNEVLFNNLDYGAYQLEYDDNYYLSENIKFNIAEFNKLYTRKIRLPEGNSNIIYLLSNTFNGALNMLNNIIVPPSYRKLYYPQYSVGTFMKKRYRLNVTDKKTRDDLIKQKTKLSPYQTKVLPNTQNNVIFSCDQLYAVMKPIVDSLTIQRCYTEFFPEFISILDKLSPSKPANTKPDSGNRIIIIDADTFAFKQGAGLEENKANPLYLLYLSFLRNKKVNKSAVDIDMMICSKNLFLKFNPSKITMDQWNLFRRALFRIMNANLDDYTDNLTPEEKNELNETGKEKVLSNIVKDTVEPYVQNVSGSTKEVLQHAVQKKVKKEAAKKAAMDAEIKKAIGNTNIEKPDIFRQTIENPNSVLHSNPVVSPLSNKQNNLFQSLAGSYQSLTTDTGMEVDDEDNYDYDRPEDTEENLEEFEDDITADAQEILVDDEEVAQEVLDEIQNNVAPLDNKRTSPINSARDKKLREEQKKVVVGKETIEEILSRDASNVPIQATDKSKVMKTSNKNMTQIKFTNFDKTYIDELYMKDIVACFDMLKDKETPFYVTGIDIKDTSTTLDFKETWTVHLKDETGKRHTVKVDIPKFQNDRFMLINGTRFIILKQNFYNPLVKDTPDTVILTTNFNKITICRKATKSLNSVERIFSLVKKSGDNKLFMPGDSSKPNMKYLSSLEYDELSRRIFRFKTDTCEICFSRDYIKDNMSDSIPTNMKGNEFFIGIEGNEPILINEDTGLDRHNRTIIEIIEQHLPPSYKETYHSIKGPTQSMYVEAKLAGQFIPIITTLIVWNGLRRTLDRMNITWKFDDKAKRVPQSTATTKYIRFADGVLEYESQTFAQLILNGISKMHPEQYRSEDFDSEIGYDEYVYSQWGSYNGITEIKRFNEFLVDPITKQVCKDLMLPDDPSGLMIHAVKLLCDNAFVSKASDKSYRVRSVEMIPSILYSCLADQYKIHVKSGRRIPMTLNQRCVITKLMAEKTVEPYSVLNPVVEVSKTHTVSTKGYKGSNSDHSYDEEKRSYDPSAVGKLAISTSPDGNVGINKVLVTEPTIANARGYREPVEDINELKDVNIFSPVELLTPGTARNDDPIRTAIAGKQSGHIVPVVDASPALISNGYDEAVQFHLSDDFVINAEEDGEVIEVNEEIGFIVVKYKSGKTRAINTKPEVVKNSGAGFFLSNQLKPTYTKVGEKFKKDEPLAYHDKYFRYSKMNGLRFSIGPLVKMGFMSSYNTYEDAGICTESLAERMKTSIVYQEVGKFKKNNNILSMVKIGDHVNIGDTLIKFDVSVEDNELAKYLSKLNEENAELLSEESKSEIKTMHAGKIIDIKVYSLLAPEQLSESLGAVVQQYFDKGTSKKEFLEKFDQNDSIMKAGYLLTDSTEPVKSRYNSIKGIKGIDVLIEIYIEHGDVMGVGDKVALYGPNKQIISEIIPKGWEPYSESRPDEEISVLTSPGTIARRMTSSIIPISAAMRCMVELKRKIKEEIKFK